MRGSAFDRREVQNKPSDRDQPSATPIMHSFSMSYRRTRWLSTVSFLANHIHQRGFRSHTLGTFFTGKREKGAGQTHHNHSHAEERDGRFCTLEAMSSRGFHYHFYGIYIANLHKVPFPRCTTEHPALLSGTPNSKVNRLSRPCSCPNYARRPTKHRQTDGELEPRHSATLCLPVDSWVLSGPSAIHHRGEEQDRQQSRREQEKRPDRCLYSTHVAANGAPGARRLIYPR